MLLDCNGVICSTFDGAVIGDDHACNAFDRANACNYTSAWYIFAGVYFVAREG